MRLCWSLLLAAVQVGALVACNSSALPEPDEQGSVAQKPGVSVSVTGTLSYQDRAYNHNGFITDNMPLIASRFVTVAMLDEAGQPLAQSQTNESGEFEFTDIPVGTATLRFISETEHSGGGWIRVYDQSGYQYAIDISVEVTETDPHFDVQMLVEDRVAGIFHMLDLYYSAFDFVADITAGSIYPDDLNVFWQWASAEGSYTCRLNSGCALGPGIYVLNDPYSSGDTDEFDDDVLLHEFAHHIESTLGMNDSPGGAHSLGSTTLDLRLAWSEGMASYFAASMKDWMRTNAPTRISVPQLVGMELADYYIDTLGSTAWVSLDLRNSSTSRYRYATNEVANAAVMLNMEEAIGKAQVWQTFLSYLSGNVSADTLEAVWDGLVGFQTPSQTELAEWQSILAERYINYELDGYESNNAFSGATELPLDESQQHTLYQSHSQTDVDWFRFAVESGKVYQLSTHSLRNGADTLISLFDESGSAVLDSNDNPVFNDDAFDCEEQSGGCEPLHDGTNFSSELLLAPLSDQTLYVRVETSNYVFDDPANYGYIGRYGTYSILLTEYLE